MKWKLDYTVLFVEVTLIDAMFGLGVALAATTTPLDVGVTPLAADVASISAVGGPFPNPIHETTILPIKPSFTWFTRTLILLWPVPPDASISSSTPSRATFARPSRNCEACTIWI